MKMVLNKEFQLYEDEEHSHTIKIIKKENEIVVEGFNTFNETWREEYNGIKIFSISFNDEYKFNMKTDLIDVITLGDMLLLKNMITLSQMIDYDTLDIEESKTKFQIREILKPIIL